MMLFLIGLTMTLPFIVAAMAVSKHKRPVALLTALAVAFFGAEIPLFVFFISYFMEPDSKAASHHGWWGCWIAGKLALTPLVLWACGSLFALECRLVERGQAVMTLGLFVGAIASTACVVYGVFMGYLCEPGTFVFMAVPAYIAFWLIVRAVENMRASQLDFISYFAALLGSLPFWIGSVVWARDIFGSLPANTSGCFVVTAASCGHEDLVGPFFEVRHHGRSQRANQQLITLWQFEELWRVRSPRSHALFRRAYNRCGPIIAARVKPKWLADATWLVLKPVEWLAGFALKNHTKTGERP